MNKTETIAGISTAMYSSGIGIVRISGDDAFSVIDRIFKPIKKSKKMAEVPSHTIHYGFIMNEDDILDEVLVLVMKAPHTYTRENTVEIDCHGGVLVTKKILELVLKSGARSADPGEFTKRAFLNGRIDLAQAEAVMDLINAENEFAMSSSVSQLRGSVSEKIRSIRGEILYHVAYIEAALDDPEHMELDNYGDTLSPVIEKVCADMEELLANADNGRILSEGIRTVILGKPNVGKSSLLNVLVGSERAIVTDIAGTTRDTLEEKIRIKDISLNIVDTAGIRNTEDVIEKIGVSRAKENAREADLVVFVVDASRELDADDMEIAGLIREKKSIVLLNKSDLETKVTKCEMEELTNSNVLEVSAKENIGIEKFADTINEMFYQGEISFNNQVFITNVRHKEAISLAYESLKMVEESIKKKMPEDFYCVDLMNAYGELGRIIGESVDEDLVDEIFCKFCMGK
ncbi:tRNA uridine-5-carboxymethylaminomethyl(34) synthesis GTPase MnmE [Parasporobacterium paucivorans]|uniref:tRNA modification GTPase MnmE n=1 Tax=Parasporobacterium paucivorans DSM 15970 TaxID=1122934 RepID=A0A1M6BA44_9FIRM|nr:tRNA uridine-5-carboxymethylaminomethyl(34) synthesis GTPase MnmE [Parasporobacterium paucivorans]SHI45343.1 tRNA modification GTPase [Parasporobacterium paucivorans DSM 15970]